MAVLDGISGIGGGPNTASAARMPSLSNVRIIATVTNACRRQGQPACADRGPNLEPIGISAWRGSLPEDEIS